MLYRNWAPTGFDRPGAFLPKRQEWHVVPVSQTRDSGPFAQSNFAVALRILGGESDTVEVHRFGHWGPGWIEVILAAPERAADVQEIADALEAYPLLSDEDYSEREYNAVTTYWERMSVRQRAAYCTRAGISIFAARRADVPQDDNGRLWDLLRPEE